MCCHFEVKQLFLNRATSPALQTRCRLRVPARLSSQLLFFSPLVIFTMPLDGTARNVERSDIKSGV